MRIEYTGGLKIIKRDELLSPSVQNAVFFLGGGETGALARGYDWTATSLGMPEDWPEALRTLVGIVLASNQPMFIIWGPDRHVIYNDGYAKVLQDRHPSAFGRPFSEAWQDLDSEIASFLDRAFAGEPSSTDEIQLVLNRPGDTREIHLAYSSTPVRGKRGLVVGVFGTCLETTDRVLAERRENFMVALSDRLRNLNDARQVMGVAAEMLGEHLGVGRCGYGEIDSSGRFFTVEEDWTNGAMPSIAGRREIAGFGKEVIAAHEAGLAVRMDDELADRRAQGSHHAYAAIGVRSGIGVPLIKDGRLRALFYVHHSAPRRWSDQDELLVREVAERTWNAVRQARAEAALRKSEGRLRALVSASAYLVFTVSADWRELREIDGSTPQITSWNPQSDWKDTFVAADDREKVDAAIAGAIRTKSVLDIEHRIRRSDGSTGWIRSCSVPFLGEDGEIIEWFGGATDITPRRLAEERLRKQDEQLRLTTAELRAVLQAAPIAVWFSADPEARYWRRNQKAAEWLGVSVDADPESSDWHEMAAAITVRRAGVEIQTADYPLNRAARGAEVRDDILEIEARDGTVRQVLCNAVPLLDGAGKIFGAVCTGTDVTIQLATERKLRDWTSALEMRISETLAERKILADVVAATDAIVQVADFEFRWLAINKASADAFEGMYGVRPKPGDSILKLMEPFPEHLAQVKALWSRALAGKEFTESIAIAVPSGETRHYEMKFNTLRNQAGERIGAYQFVHDVTERVERDAMLSETQAQLHEMQKLDTIGQLTGNVAHDFNNLLTPIVGTLDILQQALPDERRQRLVRGALKAADQARTLVQRLLAFARRQHLEARPVAIDELIEGISDLINRSIGPAIQLQLKLEASLPPAMADPNQLELALLNLAVNARDAMPNGGILTVIAQLETLDTHQKLKAGDYVRISMIDTGVGMDAETLNRAVEPFFTTKDRERGTGLGLSMVHGLAAQTGGDLELKSTPGQGTSASILLPVSAETKLQRVSETVVLPPLQNRSETILLVDDEPLVRAATAGMLEDLGFMVVEAESPREALELVQAGLDFDGLITDYAMPGMSGATLALRLLEMRPNLPVLVITGYAAMKDNEVGGLPRLSKPFRQHELAARLAEILDRQEGS